MDGIDPTLLAAGLIRCALWAFAVYLGVRSRRALVIAGYSAVLFPASLYAWTNAHGSAPVGLFDAVSYIATPAAALVVMSLYFTTRRHPEDGRRWSL